LRGLKKILYFVENVTFLKWDFLDFHVQRSLKENVIQEDTAQTICIILQSSPKKIF